jgi:hypothetical protein
METVLLDWFTAHPARAFGIGVLMLIATLGALMGGSGDGGWGDGGGGGGD